MRITQGIFLEYNRGMYFKFYTELRFHGDFLPRTQLLNDLNLFESSFPLNRRTA